MNVNSPSKYRLQDLIDIEHFQRLQDRMNEIYAFPSSIIDNDGNILTASGWQKICTDFHRKNKECEKACVASDLYILEHLNEANPAVTYKCPRGLVDCATPIIIDDVHYGNFFTGQFFLESPDINFFKEQAKNFGFDETAYLTALKKVPLWTQEQLNSYMFFIKELIAIISESGLAKLKAMEAEKQAKESEERYHSLITDLKRERDTSQNYLDVAGVMLLALNDKGNIILVNKKGCEILEGDEKEILGKNWFDNFIPSNNAGYVKTVFGMLMKGEKNDIAENAENRVIALSGREKIIAWKNTMLKAEDGRITGTLSSGEDVTDKRMTEEELRRSKEQLESLWNINRIADADIKTICNRVLDEIQKMTKSEYAFFGFISGDEKEMILYAWSEKTMSDCSVADELLHFPIDKAGIWARAVKERQIITLNNFQADMPGKKGVPAGHVPLRRVMTVPMVENNKVLSIAAVANKDTDYTADDEKQVNSFLKNLQIIFDRKKKEDELKESDSEHSIILKTAMDGFWMVDPKGFLLDVNDSYCSMSGYSREELLRMHVSELEAVDSPLQIADRMKKIFDEGEDRFIRRHKRKDGSLFDVEISAGYQPELEGRFFCFVHDISEFRQMADSLSRSLERLDLATRAARIGIWDWDVLKNEMIWDERMYELYGARTEEFSGDYEGWLSLIHPDDRTLLERLSGQALRGQPFDTELRIPLPDGDERVVRVYGKAIRDNQGNPTRMTGISYDITDRKRSEIALRESENRYRTIVENLNDALLQVDFKGNILDVNENTCRMTGYERKELIGKNIVDLSHSDYRSRLESQFEILLKGESIIFEGKLKRKDGTMLPVEVSSKLVTREGEGVIQSFVRDITERKQMLEQLQQSQKMESIGTLAGGIAHDFNNILSPILIHSEMVMNDLPPDSNLKTNMLEIYKAGERARNLVRQILTFARKKTEKKFLFNASVIIKETIQFIRSTIPATIEIIQRFNYKKDTIFADPTQINQILMNLCSNSAYAMKEKGGTLEISLDNETVEPDRKERLLNLSPGKYLRLAVRDTGEGIPPEALDKIYDPYFTTKEPGEGTGLGLAIIHGIVKKYNGDIIVESELGKGTKFTIYLPITEDKALASEAREIIESENNEHILFVDDEEASVRAMKKMLEMLGYRVTATTKSADALKFIRDDPDSFDLVISDMTMPVMTGKELAGELLSIRRDLPVIICTGYDTQIDEKTAKELGIRTIVMKPIVLKEMSRIIREVLTQKS